MAQELTLETEEETTITAPSSGAKSGRVGSPSKGGGPARGRRQKSPGQDSTPPPEEPAKIPATKVTHSGDLGDIIYALPVINLLPDPKFHFVDRSFTKHLTSRLPFLTPLLDANGIQWSEEDFPANAHLDMENFRSGWKGATTITDIVADWVEARTQTYIPRNLTDKPWLSVEPLREAGIMIARSSRYHNPTFPWQCLKGMDTMFLGTEEEFRDLRKMIPDLNHRPVKDALEMARLIAGSEVFIGNQSFPLSLAIAMHHPSIMEPSTFALDCFHRGPFVYWDGKPLQFKGVTLTPKHAKPTQVLRGGYLPVGIIQHGAMRMSGMSFEDALRMSNGATEQELVDWNATNHPHWCGPKPQVYHSIQRMTAKVQL